MTKQHILNWIEQSYRNAKVAFIIVRLSDDLIQYSRIGTEKVLKMLRGLPDDYVFNAIIDGDGDLIIG